MSYMQGREGSNGHRLFFLVGMVSCMPTDGNQHQAFNTSTCCLYLTSILPTHSSRLIVSIYGSPTPTPWQGHVYRSRTGKVERWFNPNWISLDYIPQEPADLPLLKVAVVALLYCWPVVLTQVCYPLFFHHVLRVYSLQS